MNYYSIKRTNRLMHQSVLLIGALLMISVSSALSQIAFFANADCGVDVSITANCPTMTWISVPVSGVGNLGADNYGIDGVGVVLSQSAGFACNIYLRAPNDSIYLLASGEEGLNSFPNYSNGPLNIEFKGCPNLPFSSANVAQPSGKSYQPFDDFTELNDLGINPNGDWEIGFCGLPDDITVSCVNLTFNLICPEVVAVNVTDASCSAVNDGTIELITDGGSCFPTYFSLNNGLTVTTSHWEGLSPGAYTIHITNYLSSERSSALSICEQDVQVNVSMNDLTPPTITCPPDLTVYIPDNAANDTCQWVAPLTFEVPTFSDNCGIVSAQFDYYLDDIFYGTQNRNLGESGAKYENYVYQYGINRFVYRVSDGNQTSECTYFITVVDTIAPIWWPPTADTVLTFECDGTNYNIPDSLQYWAYDHRLCGNDFTKFTLIDHQTICGFAYEDLYEVTLYDPSGNENPEKRHVIVRLQDTHPPVLSGVPSGSAIAYCGSAIEGLPEIGNQITAYDSCLGDVTDRIQVAISSTVFGCELPDTIGIYEQITYTYSVADDCGHETVQSFVVNVLDTTAPVFTGMLPDVTITCDQVMPAMPVITAFDSCYGDVSDRITMASSIQSGDCTTGSLAQIVQYSWDVTDPCGNAAHYDWTVTVMNNLNVDLGPDRVLCKGDTAYLNAGHEGSSYLWSTGATTQQIAVKNAGTYIVTVTSTNGCCAMDTIDIVVNPLPVVTASGGTLSCNQPTVTLNGTSSITGSSFLWNGPQGFTSANSSEAVTVPGIYQLTVTSPLGCAVQTTIEVPIDTVSPAFELRDDTLTCSKDSLRLFVSPVVSDYTYAWSGPDNFHSGELNPWTNTPGDYTLVVTAPNGCSTMASLTIVSDQTPPAFELHDDTLTCSKDSLRLFVSPAVSDYTYAWSGPGNFHSSELNPWTKTPGDYTLVVTAPNGCSTMASLTIVSDQTPPAFELHDDTLTCSKDSLRLFVSPAVSDFTYAWSGPGNFHSSELNPWTKTPGDYTLLVTAPNGCKTMASLTIESNKTPPAFELHDDTLTCSKDSLRLFVSPAVSDYTYAWSGPGNFHSSELNPRTQIPGDYTLVVTAPNGCKTMASLTIVSDQTPPAFELHDDTLTCSKDSLQLFVSPAVSDYTYAWSGPSNFHSSELNPWTQIPGDYTLEVKAPNGCSTMASLTIVSDQTPPAFELHNDTLTCSKDSLRLFVSPAVSDYTYAWSGPGNFHSSELNPWTQIPGDYTLEVTAPNGCTTMASLTIVQDNALPVVHVMSDTLTCDVDSLQLSLQVDQQQYQIAWTGPAGFTSAKMNPWVNEAGIYQGAVKGANGCVTTFELDVIADQSLPNFTVKNDTLTCLKDSVQLTVLSTQPDITYFWAYADTIVFPDSNPWVKSPGKYFVFVTGANGCSRKKSLTVIRDTASPLINITAGTVNCMDHTQRLTALSNPLPGVFTWSGPDNFSADSAWIDIHQEGLYKVTFTGRNGCPRSDEYQALLSSPSVTISGDSLLTCSNNSVLLTGISADAIRYQWTGPDGFSAEDMMIQVFDPGNYSLVVSNTQNCMDSAQLTVQKDVSLPDLQVSGGIIPCNNGTLQISATSMVGTSFSWSGPDGFMSDLSDPVVTKAGQYTLTVSDSLGCTVSKSVMVTNPPPIQVTINTSIHPNGDLGDASVFVTSGTGPFQVLWDNGDTSFMTIDLSLDTHWVQVTDKYGCTEEFSFGIDASTAVQDSRYVEHLQVFPNPGDEYVNIDLALRDQYQSTRMLLIDLTGRIRWEKEYSRGTVQDRIPAYQLSEGWYVLKVISRNVLTSRPVIIVH